MKPLADLSGITVLVIDDNDDFRKLALLWFQIHGIEAEGAANGAQGLELQRARPASVIVTDIFMPEKEGIETIQDLRREFPDAKIIAMTGRESLTDYDVFQVARELGVVKTFKKPFKLDDLVAAVEEISRGA
jgi:CheY-like chemotaxis protein